MRNLNHNQMMPNEQNIRFQRVKESLVFSLASTLSVFHCIFDLVFEISLIFGAYSIESLAENAIGFPMNIKWTYLMLWVDS